MESLPLSFGVLLSYLQRAISEIDAPRQASNGTRYSLSDAILGAFRVFFMQCESFLEHQRQLQSRRGKDNAQSLFGLGQIPTTAQIRNILDGIAAKHLFSDCLESQEKGRKYSTLLMLMTKWRLGYPFAERWDETGS